MKMNASDQGITLYLGRSLELSAVHEDAAILKRIVEIKQPIIIEAEQVAHVSSAHVQLLMAFTRTLRAQKITYHWGNISNELRHTTTLMGAADIFDEK